MSVILPDTPTKVSLPVRAQIHFFVTLSRILSRMPPARLRSLLAQLSTGARPATYSESKRARDVVLTASARCRGQSACLVRSLTIVLLCRTRGIWPTWCVGVLAAPPFTAHAWVEADGEIVDEPMRSTDFRKFFSIPARPKTISNKEGR
ncbi:lasso peptide biosynthesis B2 protein [Nocardia transvalensis]|uniref:lasso peptide biosynthesis B2 protein n=1 Tax=Nocardia transvalensis TaxID=37333 RepID=UPI001893F3C7|nr:lasso peptide biosynthesis B2 protein [Nocardia transvalensis]MBF6332534.1 lasso peptide biosynthesis B2 protein [Nocardia transvalensis]